MSTGFPTQYQDTLTSKFDFYSGSQISVWFGNIFMDDINSIQWARNQNKVPIYGYASQNFDAVANGTVIVQGTFTINFRQQGYIPAVVSEIRGLYKEISSKDANFKSQNTQAWSTMSNLISKHLQNGTFGPQTTADLQQLGNSPDFFELAKTYESIIWGDQMVTDQDAPRYPADVQQATDIGKGFNIMIAYGAPQNQDSQSRAERMRSTVKTLEGVHLIGESQVIAVGGRPVQEQYSFIARNTDTFIGVNR
jgi:hypothetical protein